MATPRSTSDETQTEGPNEDNPTIYDSISKGPELRRHMEKATGFLKGIQRRQALLKDTELTRALLNILV